MSNFSHIIYTFIFSTIPLLFISIRHRQKLYDNRKVILYILLLVLIYAILAETVAMKMGLWYHDKEKVLNIPFGDPIDDILVAPILLPGRFVRHCGRLRSVIYSLS